ncbi:hypothetical protein I312_102769 [Cryptococcus bacillisporus CA1280]|uniref:uncharacterized protein n=1 Tax=Cryptococcus bacillisporus CA1280 TaxID=1296109 RepID=UPI0033690FAE
MHQGLLRKSKREIVNCSRPKVPYTIKYSSFILVNSILIVLLCPIYLAIQKIFFNKPWPHGIMSSLNISEWRLWHDWLPMGKLLMMPLPVIGAWLTKLQKMPILSHMRRTVMKAHHVFPKNGCLMLHSLSGSMETSTIRKKFKNNQGQCLNLLVHFLEGFLGKVLLYKKKNP